MLVAGVGSQSRSPRRSPWKILPCYQLCLLPVLCLAAGTAASAASSTRPWSRGELHLPPAERSERTFLLGPSHFLPRHLEEAKITNEQMSCCLHCRKLGQKQVDGAAFDGMFWCQTIP